MGSAGCALLLAPPQNILWDLPEKYSRPGCFWRVGVRMMAPFVIILNIRMIIQTVNQRLGRTEAWLGNVEALLETVMSGLIRRHL